MIYACKYKVARVKLGNDRYYHEVLIYRNKYATNTFISWKTGIFRNMYMVGLPHAWVQNKKNNTISTTIEINVGDTVHCEEPIMSTQPTMSYTLLKVNGDVATYIDQDGKILQGSLWQHVIFLLQKKMRKRKINELLVACGNM